MYVCGRVRNADVRNADVRTVVVHPLCMWNPTKSNQLLKTHPPTPLFSEDELTARQRKTQERKRKKQRQAMERGGLEAMAYQLKVRRWESPMDWRAREFGDVLR